MILIFLKIYSEHLQSGADTWTSQMQENICANRTVIIIVTFVTVLFRWRNARHIFGVGFVCEYFSQ